MAKKNNTNSVSEDQVFTKIRIDKWLWAARFFKTRSLAKQAIEGGKVHYNGKRVKVSKDVHVGMTLTVRQGMGHAGNEKEVLVKALSDNRGKASDAALLYEETLESIQRRADYANQRKLANLARPDFRPNKKQRRKLADLHSQNMSYSYDSDDDGY